MNSTLALLENELAAIQASLLSTIPNSEPLNIAHSNWSFPGVTRDDLIGYATSLITQIQSKQEIINTKSEPIIADYIRRLTFLRTNTIPHIWGGNSALATSAYISTMISLKNVLEDSFESSDIEKIKIQIDLANQQLKNITKPLRAIEVRLSDLNSRSMNVEEKILGIEAAHEAANQLPTDLETLKESKKELDTLLKRSNADEVEIKNILSNIKKIENKIMETDLEAVAIIARCDKSYRAMTSQGLASAFAKRADALNRSMWVWVFGLIVALYLGFNIGSSNLHNLAISIDSLATNQSGSIWINLTLTLISVGAPVWFAWVATKQIGQRFRLAEDYGYKSTISTAYEGYRREAELLDPAFQAKLFSSALSRLDEVPLRLVETETHGSPWHELACSKSVKDALAIIPDFTDKVSDFTKNLLSKVKTPTE